MGIRKPRSAFEPLLVIIVVLGFCPLPRLLSAAADPPVFREAAQETGLDFHHFIGATGDYFFPEIMGSGVGMFDYDGDGDLDLYFVQGADAGPGQGGVPIRVSLCRRGPRPGTACSAMS